jgi:hypothetical protein
MFDFVPIEYYSDIYYNIVLLLVIVTWVHTKSYSGFTKKTFLFNKVLGMLLYWFTVLYMGLRPVSWYFGDMGNYAKKFDMYTHGMLVNDKGDVVFYQLMEILAFFDSKTLFFFVVSFIYVSAVYIATKRLFGNYHYFAFLIMVASFEFWSYGTNGIRNGLATSLMLLAFSYMNKKWFMYLLFLLAFYIHSSVIIPIAAYFISSIYKSSKFYYKVWVLSILLSWIAGKTIENIVISLGIMKEDIMNTYFLNKDQYASSFSMTGFRWDFLLYSFTAVAVSYYFIVVKKINDRYYQQLTNIYLLSNAAWILVIGASFSNRFAYLSWFMMGLVIIYPLLTKVYWKKQFSYIGLIIIIYYSFTYLMKFVLPNL